jgi:hypothetical protein
MIQTLVTQLVNDLAIWLHRLNIDVIQYLFTVNKCSVQFLSFVWGHKQCPFQAILGNENLECILTYIQYIALLILHLASEEQL